MSRSIPSSRPTRACRSSASRLTYRESARFCGSPRLAYDDLKVVASNREQIICRGLVEVDDLASGIHSEISVDPRTGEQRSGPRFRG